MTYLCACIPWENLGPESTLCFSKCLVDGHQMISKRVDGNYRTQRQIKQCFDDLGSTKIVA